MEEKMNCRSFYPAAALLVIAASATHGAAAQPATASDSAVAHANINDAQGKTLGVAALTQMAHGVLIRVELSGVPPGTHGFHIHEIGKCEPPAFTSAGSHFNPAGHKHGYNAAAGPHAGDLPNIIARPDGTATVEILVGDVALSDSHIATASSTPDRPTNTTAGTPPPGANALMGQAGASLVIHAKPDDYASDPAGNSGDRIACGVIEQ
jgi:superoxide dismutase, Cu-Zn family